MIAFHRPLSKRNGETGARGGLNLQAHLFRQPGMISPGRFLRLLILISLILVLPGCRPATSPGPGEMPTADLPPTGLVVRKVITGQPGIYTLRATELAGMGVDLTAVDSRPIRMYWRGRSIPVWINHDLGGDLRFYARASQSIYSRVNTYWLVQGDQGVDPDVAYWKISEGMPQDQDLAPAQALVSPQGLPAGVYGAAVHLEENTQYYPQVEQGDHWLWTYRAGCCKDYLPAQGRTGIGSDK